MVNNAENRKPNKNKLGNQNVIFLCSGYHEFKIGRAFPNLLTCIWNFSQLILLLWYTKAFLINLVLKPKFHNRIDKSGSSPGWIFPKPFDASNAFLDNPMLKLRG